MTPMASPNSTALFKPRRAPATLVPSAKTQHNFSKVYFIFNLTKKINNERVRVIIYHPYLTQTLPQSPTNKVSVSKQEAKVAVNNCGFANLTKADQIELKLTRCITQGKSTTLKTKPNKIKVTNYFAS
jgi:hypothetical protein